MRGVADPTAIPLLVACVALVAVSGCTGREGRIAAALRDAGLSPTLAACVAEPLARDLGSDQLRALQRAAELAAGDGRDLRTGQLLDSFRQSGLDAETVALVTRASLGCMFRG